MIGVALEKRGTDDWGSGEFGVSRGDRTHKGIDYACLPLKKVMSPCQGVVTKVGYPYADDLSYRYVEVTDDDSYKHRVFYISPLVEVDDIVVVGTILGEAQNISARYTKINKVMKNHIHLEILDKHDHPVNPEEF